MKTNIYILFISIVLFISCKEKNNQPEKAQASIQKKEVLIDTIKTPTGYTKLAEAKGDLDKDGIDEKVLVYDTKRKTDMGTEREIQIFKNKENKWILWHKSIGAVLPSKHGGLLGDPFAGISIKNSSIIINQHGGSRDKWKYTHIYRYQNNKWKLIGLTIETNTPCKNKITFDYNLSTGKAIVTKEIFKCNDEAKVISSKREKKNITHKLKTLPNMDGYYPGDNEIDIPEIDEILFY